MEKPPGVSLTADPTTLVFAMLLEDLLFWSKGFKAEPVIRISGKLISSAIGKAPSKTVNVLVTHRITVRVDLKR